MSGIIPGDILANVGDEDWRALDGRIPITSIFQTVASRVGVKPRDLECSQI